MINNIQTVVKEDLCLGCGACIAICPQRAIYLVQDPIVGNYPKVLEKQCSECGRCIKVCPGIGSPDRKAGKYDTYFGGFQSVYLGHAVEKTIQFNGASGGVVTALAVYLLESNYVDGILMIRMDSREPTKNKVFIAHSRRDVLSAQGSRYSPASVCELIGEIIRRKDKYAIIGKPCDIQGVRKIVDVKKPLTSNIKLCIGIFCANTLVRQATLNLLSYQGISLDDVVSLRYRGEGWPGSMTILLRGGTTRKIPYAQMWSDFRRIEQYIVQRCFLCPDGTAEWADISVGDPWHLVSEGKSDGNSLIIIRTDFGAEIFDNAIQNGYVVANKVSPKALYQAQLSLIAKRKAIWPQLFVWKLLGKKIPQFKGFPLYTIYKNQSIQKKIRSIVWALYLTMRTQRVYRGVKWIQHRFFNW